MLPGPHPKVSNNERMVKEISARRAPHRPSRRAHITSSAMSLFARMPYDAVTVADIAALADLTPAAVYYHFDGKEQILLEGMREFSQELLRVAIAGVEADMEIGALMGSLFGHVRARRTSATVFFVTAAGLSLGFEAHRKLVRAELAELFAVAARTQRNRLPKAEAGVIGATLVSLLEVSASAALRGDRSFTTLGVRRSTDLVADLARRTLGL